MSVLQFKIMLKGIYPPIWRQIQVSSLCTFWDLHVAIQDAMGWEDYHLHLFEIINSKTGKKEVIGIPEDNGFDDDATMPGWNYKVSDYIHAPANQQIVYVYDFGDHWEHIIEFEGEYKKQIGKKYPLCLSGKRACPPEDVGGIHGYQNYAQIMLDPLHPRYSELMEWRGKFDAEKFDPRMIKFSDPNIRWKRAFVGG